MIHKELIRQGVFSIGLSLLVGLSSCKRSDDSTYPNAPQIRFKGFSRYTLDATSGIGQQKRDSLVISIGFTDGNGDLGDNLPLSSQDSTLYRQAGGWGNYQIRTFRLVNTQFQELPVGENNFLLFPRLSRPGQNGPIEGTLDFKQLYYYSHPYKIYPTKYRIQIRDRALNISNEIETDTVNVPYLN